MKHLSTLGKFANFLWLSLVYNVALAQSSAELTATLRQISGQLKPVSGTSQSFEQTASFESLRPYLVEISVTEIDKKGQTIARKYALNLADVDPGSIVFEARKELMVVTLKTKSKLAFITQKENDIQKNNNAQLIVYGIDADNARALADLFRKAATLADKQFLADVRLPDTYDGLVQWVVGNLDSTPASTESLQQSAEADKANPLVMKLLQIRTEGGKNTEQLYLFNTADLNPQHISMDVNGSVITVELENKDRFIRLRKNGQWERNTSSASILCLTAYKARIMQIAWQKLLPLAIRQLDGQRAKFSQYTSLDDGLKRLSAAVKPVEDGADHLDQQLTPACLTTLTLKASGRKPLDETYRFRWSDLDGHAAKLRSDGGGFVVEIPTKDKGRWITLTQNGERRPYASAIEIKSNDLESIRFVPALLDKLITDCQKSMATTALPTGGIRWIADKVTELQDPKGQMSYQLKPAGDNCTYTYTVRQNTGKKPGELSWDLKLADIDPQAVKIAVSGSELGIDLATTGKTKVIKAYKDGLPISYTNQLSMLINDLEIARPMVELWKQSIIGCRK